MRREVQPVAQPPVHNLGSQVVGDLQQPPQDRALPQLLDDTIQFTPPPGAGGPETFQLPQWIWTHTRQQLDPVMDVLIEVERDQRYEMSIRSLLGTRQILYDESLSYARVVEQVTRERDDARHQAALLQARLDEVLRYAGGSGSGDIHSSTQVAGRRGGGGRRRRDDSPHTTRHVRGRAGGSGGGSGDGSTSDPWNV